MLTDQSTSLSNPVSAPAFQRSWRKVIICAQVLNNYEQAKVPEQVISTQFMHLLCTYSVF